VLRAARQPTRITALSRDASGLPANTGRLTRAGGWAWIATVEFFAIQLVAQTAAPGFSMTRHDISALGIPVCGQQVAVCSPLHPLFDAGLILVGILTTAGALLTWRAWPGGPISRVGLGLLSIAGLGAIVAGVADVHTCPIAHAIGASLDFGAGGLGMMMMGLACRRRAPGLAWFSAAAGSIVVAAFLLYAAGLYLGIGRGGMERVAAISATLWFVLTGVWLLARIHRSDRAATADR